MPDEVKPVLEVSNEHLDIKVFVLGKNQSMPMAGCSSRWPGPSTIVETHYKDSDELEHVEYEHSSAALIQKLGRMIDTTRFSVLIRDGKGNEDVRAAVPSVDVMAPVPDLAGSRPLVLYFATDGDRDEFIDVFREVKPNAVTRKL